MSSLLILLGIVLTALTPTGTVLVSRMLDRQDRREVARRLHETQAHASAARVEVAQATTAVAAVSEQVASLKVTTTAQLEEIHLLVNSRLTQALERIKGLEDALGISPEDEVPPKVI